MGGIGLVGLLMAAPVMGLGQSSSALAAAVPSSPSAETFDYVPDQAYGSLLAHVNATIWDGYLGAQFTALFFPDFGLGLTGSFYARPGRKSYNKRINLVGEDRLWQLRENRYQFGLGPEVQAELADQVHLFLQGQAAYTFGNYHGTRVVPPRGFLFVPSAGFSFLLGQVGLARVGYQYQSAKDPDVPEHRLMAQIGFRFKTKN
jgi:hypothetical protein